MTTSVSTYQQLRGHLAQLKLAAAAEALPAMLEQARATHQSHTEFLEALLSIEVAAGARRKREIMLKFSSLPAPWTIADFDFSAQPSLDQSLIRELATGRFTEDATNVLFIGPPGVGKTMLAVAVGRAVVEAGIRTYYTAAADLVARCRKASLEGRWAAAMQTYCGPSLLIIDELGYLAMPAEDASHLFQVISRRYLKSSIILTTNRGVSSWGQIFSDSTIAAAMLDRLLHRSVVIQIEGESYRMRQYQARTQRPPKEVTI